ncbi:FAD/NAD(P)-binding domain-containing protein [Hypoxylon fragiforme]|uniref:FAD/NAD(P)-binding domain-containing protein n=1 Tax=Hypoxylon fragiforme TaxID=63214 RepID=UPI0020C5D0D1|nr:FAD/NAD(P)-binding domain-containing protein [Hypoxylon fragiforme]KAI2608887.1 FAD/NAD(P)-binding domain-containing protein [Hypoxylon fragiforme]
MAEQRIKVAIVGGGIAGLALAAGLAKLSHIDVHVYESVPEYKDIGAGLALHLNAIKAMALIGPELRQAYFDKALSMGEENEEMVTQVILAQGPHSGQLVAELGRAKGRKTVSRADLLAGFLELVPAACISFGKKLVGIHEKPPPSHNDDHDHKVTLVFADGTNAVADCLLGADGIHSPTRRHILGADHPAATPKNHDGWQIYRTLVSAEEARKHIDAKWTTSVPILLGPRGHINCIPLSRNTRLSAGVAVRRGPSSAAAALSPSSQTTPPPLDPSLYADYTPDAQRIVSLVALDPSASWSAADHDHAPSYIPLHPSTPPPRIAILGDAAHASLPFAGNGAAQALEDAAVLYHLFARGVASAAQIGSALIAYDAARRPRSQRVVEVARRFGRVYAFAEEDGEGEGEGRKMMHEDPERMREFFAEMARFTNEFDVEGQNEEALRVFGEVEGGASGLRN